MDSILAKFHNRLSDDPVGSRDPSHGRQRLTPACATRQNLEKLQGIALEGFSSANFPALDQEIIINTLTRPENTFTHLDLSNMTVSSMHTVADAHFLSYLSRGINNLSAMFTNF